MSTKWGKKRAARQQAEYEIHHGQVKRDRRLSLKEMTDFITHINSNNNSAFGICKLAGLDVEQDVDFGMLLGHEYIHNLAERNFKEMKMAVEVDGDHSSNNSGDSKEVVAKKAQNSLSTLPQATSFIPVPTGGVLVSELNSFLAYAVSRKNFLAGKCFIRAGARPILLKDTALRLKKAIANYENKIQYGSNEFAEKTIIRRETRD